MKKEPKIGIVARIDNGGLGNMTYDFWKNLLSIEKELVVIIQDSNNDLYRYPKGILCDGYPGLVEINDFLNKINILLVFETPYNWNVISQAKKRGIKVVFIPMYEWSNPVPPVEPDVYLCPSLLDYDIYKEQYKDTDVKVKYLPIPVDTNEIKSRIRYKARTFVFNNGGGGSLGRNGLKEFLQAIKLVKAQDIEFIIRSQVAIPLIQDKRIRYETGQIQKRSDLFKDGDVFVFPHKFNGLSLPIQEALAAGMPVLSTDIYPHNEYLPEDWLFKHEGVDKVKVTPAARTIDSVRINPQKLADKIDEYANQNIAEDSKIAIKIAKGISWKTLLPKYQQFFKSLL